MARPRPNRPIAPGAAPRAPARVPGAAEPVRALAERGFVSLPGRLERAALEELRAVWERAAGADALADLQGEPAVAALAARTDVVRLVATLLGEDPEPFSCRGREPRAGLGQQGLHVDAAYAVAPDDQQLVNAFWWLDDVGAQNGGTRLVPGSHRWRRVPRGAVAQPTHHHVDEVVPSLRAGDVLLFSSHLWHSGTANRSGARRRLLIVQYRRRQERNAP